MNKKPISDLIHPTDELKALIAEHPDYPIVVLCETELVADDTYQWWYAPDVRFELGEILVWQDIDNEHDFMDRDTFEDALRMQSEDLDECIPMTDEEFDAYIDNRLKEYEQYWTSVILIKAGV